MWILFSVITAWSLCLLEEFHYQWIKIIAVDQKATSAMTLLLLESALELSHVSPGVIQIASETFTVNRYVTEDSKNFIRSYGYNTTITNLWKTSKSEEQIRTRCTYALCMNFIIFWMGERGGDQTKFAMAAPKTSNCISSDLRAFLIFGPNYAPDRSNLQHPCVNQILLQFLHI